MSCRGPTTMRNNMTNHRWGFNTMNHCNTGCPPTVLTLASHHCPSGRQWQWPFFTILSCRRMRRAQTNRLQSTTWWQTSNNNQHAEVAMEDSGWRQCRAMVAGAATGQRKWQKTDAWKQRGRKMDGRADHKGRQWWWGRGEILTRRHKKPPIWQCVWQCTLVENFMGCILTKVNMPHI